MEQGIEAELPLIGLFFSNMGLTVEVAGKSDIGCVRKNNEDNLGWDTRAGIFVVCDGMGGAAAGEVASKMGVDTLLAYFRDGLGSGVYPQAGPSLQGVSERAQRLSSAIHLANASIHQAGSQKSSHRGMGSTIVAVAVGGESFSIGHVGDSRIYLIRAGAIRQLTNDHSLVMEQVRRGLITKEEAEHSEMQNIIIRALGSEATVQPDLEDLAALPGDVLLLASDGLTKHVKDDAMLAIVEQAASLDVACDQLIQTAKNHGGDDNITCVLVRMAEQPWYKKLLSGGGGAPWQNSL
jgi:PPM family protein phosphatase